MRRLEEDIRDRLAQWEAEPPMEAWQAIADRLDGQKPAVFPWRKLAAAVAMLIAGLGALLYLIPGIQDTEKPLVAVQETRMEPAAQSVLSDDVVINMNIAGNAGEPSRGNQVSLPSDARVERPSPIQRASSGTHIALASSKPEMTAPSVANKSVLPISAVMERPVLIPSGSSLALHPAGPLTSMGLISETVETSRPSMSLMAFYSPQVSYRFRTRDAYMPFEALESELPSFSAGLQLAVRLSKRFEMRSGASYNRVGQIINHVAVFSNPTADGLYYRNGVPLSVHPQSLTTSLGEIRFVNHSLYFADMASGRVLTLRNSFDETDDKILIRKDDRLVQEFNFIEIPLIFSYNLIRGKVNLAVKAGTSASLLHSNGVYLHGNNRQELIGESVTLNMLNWSGMGGLVLSYPVQPNIRLNIEPTANFFILPISSRYNLAGPSYPYTYSVYFGVSYGF